jgi:hypothetical protein
MKFSMNETMSELIRVLSGKAAAKAVSVGQRRKAGHTSKLIAASSESRKGKTDAER